MTIATIIQEAPAIWGGLGTVGGVATAVPLSKWWEHRRETKRIAISAEQDKREQTDDVALSLVEELRGEMAAIRAEQQREREVCDAKLEAADNKMAVLRHELRNVEASFDGLLLALKYAPPDRAPEIIADVMAMRQGKKGPPVQKVEVTVAPTP